MVLFTYLYIYLFVCVFYYFYYDLGILNIMAIPVSQILSFLGVHIWYQWAEIIFFSFNYGK